MIPWKVMMRWRRRESDKEKVGNVIERKKKKEHYHSSPYDNILRHHPNYQSTDCPMSDEQEVASKEEQIDNEKKVKIIYAISLSLVLSPRHQSLLRLLLLSL